VKKFKGIDIEEQNINNGLDKLAEATRGIDELKISLKKEDATLKIAADQTAFYLLSSKSRIRKLTLSLLKSQLSLKLVLLKSKLLL